MNDDNRDESITSSRRMFLTRMAAVGLGVAALGVTSAEAATEPHQPAADTGHDYPMPAPHAMTEKQYRMGVIPIAVLSRAASGLAVDKAKNASTLEFANFELREANAIYGVLKDLGTPTPPLDAHAKAILATLKTSQGTAFDKAYIKAQLAAHEYLRDLGETYLNNSAGHTGMAETNGRHMATLMLYTFKEHVVLCKDIKAELQA